MVADAQAAYDDQEAAFEAGDDEVVVQDAEMQEM